ncbi:MAG: DUF4097 family beta strand repeat protein [Acidobacteriota bacterium]|nr:DUF4097 family beta strand repeat protein [Acidobacteriota bacterium]
MRPSIFFAVALAAIAGFAAPARADVWSKSYRLTGKPQLTVDSGDGSVTIVSRDQKQIDAHLTTTGWRIGSEVKVEEHQTGNAIEIDIRIPRNVFNFFPRQHNVHLELDVPRNADLNIHTGDGAITCDPVSGTVTLDSGDGSISAQGLTGSVRLHSGDGSIQASSIDGSLNASSGDGRITVRGRFDSLDLHSGDGSIEAAASSGSRISSAWSVRTGDGSIHVSLPENFGADLDVHTGDGRITMDFPVTVSGVLNRSTIRGKLGAGGGPLTIRSGDGSIHIEKE